VVLAVGATTIEEVVAPPGDHAYVYGVLPPLTLAVSVTLFPEQDTVLVAVGVTVRLGVTVTVIVPLKVREPQLVEVPVNV
jgi:hypothetical protein